MGVNLGYKGVGAINLNLWF